MWRLMLEFPFFNTIFQDSSRILSESHENPIRQRSNGVFLFLCTGFVPNSDAPCFPIKFQ